MTTPKCKCSHTADTHGRDRMGRAVCRSVACGCIAYRGASDPIPAGKADPTDTDIRLGDRTA